MGKVTWVSKHSARIFLLCAIFSVGFAARPQPGRPPPGRPPVPGRSVPGRPGPPQKGKQANALGKLPSPNFVCGPDTLLIYQDCRVCACPKAYKLAKCYKKECEPRKKSTGTCPAAILRLDDMNLCDVQENIIHRRGPVVQKCTSDTDCPGPQLCCPDFCKGYRCVNPAVSKPNAKHLNPSPPKG